MIRGEKGSDAFMRLARCKLAGVSENVKIRSGERMNTGTLGN